MRLQLTVTLKQKDPYDHKEPYEYELTSFDNDDKCLSNIICLSDAEAFNRLLDWQSLLFAGGIPFTTEVRFD